MLVRAVALGLIVVTSRLPAFADQPPLTAQQIFDRARDRVREQLTHSGNYTCVETVSREYNLGEGTRVEGCDARSLVRFQKPYMHDKLRLDVAVSEGKEIFSWHGGSRFQTGGIDQLVKTGPISSGSFVGYLQNIFFHEGVHIRKLDSSDLNYHFEFEVPLSASGQYVSNGRGSDLTAFHGTMTIDSNTFDLVQLTTVIASPPRKSKICYIRSTIEYQTVPISGLSSRVPKEYKLEMDDSTHLYTTSVSDYAQCKAFGGESTISFKIDDVAALNTFESHDEKPLPANITLPISLQTEIDDIHSFAGDPVRGTLTHAVKLPHDLGTLSKGATVTGFVSRVENRYQPSGHIVLGVRFNRLTDGHQTYTFDAASTPTLPSREALQHIYGSPVPDYISHTLDSGVFVFLSDHASLKPLFTANWKTVSNQDQAEQ